MTARISLRLQAALLALLVLGLYGRTVRYHRVDYDDVVVLNQERAFENDVAYFSDSKAPALARAQGLLQLAVRQMPGRLLRDLSYAMDERTARAAGLDPDFVLHLSNILWHLLACLLAWSLMRRLLPEAGGSEGWWAWFGAALFAAHPLQCESVAYIAGRRDLLLGVFYLAGLAAYIEFRRSSRRGWLVLAAACWFLALNSKQSAVTLPLACWLYDLYKGKKSHLRWRRAWPIGLALTLAAGILVLRQIADVPWTFNGGSVTTHLLTAAAIDWRALALLAWPRLLVINYDGAPFLRVSGAGDPVAWLRLALLLAAAAYSQTLWRRRPLPAFAAAFFALTFLPTSGLIPWNELFAEHWLYLPLFGPCLAAAWAAGRLPRRRPWRAAAPALCAVLLAGFAARMAARERAWRDPEIFWTTTVADAPWSPMSHYGLASVYRQEGKTAAALAQYQSALAERPRLNQVAAIYSDMAAIYGQSGQLAQARRLLERAAPLSPDDYMLNYNLGVLYQITGQPGRAEAAFRRSVATHLMPEAANNLSALCFSRGDLSDALRFCRLANQKKPKDPALLDNLGFLEETRIRQTRLGLRGAKQAEKAYLEAIRWNKDPRFLKPYYHLAHLYAEQGEPERAAAVLRTLPR